VKMEQSKAEVEVHRKYVKDKDTENAELLSHIDKMRKK